MICFCCEFYHENKARFIVHANNGKKHSKKAFKSEWKNSFAQCDRGFYYAQAEKWGETSSERKDTEVVSSRKFKKCTVAVTLTYKMAIYYQKSYSTSSKNLILL